MRYIALILLLTVMITGCQKPALESRENECTDFVEMIVTVPVLNVRSKPDQASEKVRSLNDGQRIFACKTEIMEPINQFSGYWYKVKSNNNEYVYSQFVSIVESKKYNENYAGVMAYGSDQTQNKGFFYLFKNGTIQCKIPYNDQSLAMTDLSSSNSLFFISPGTDVYRTFFVYDVLSCKLLDSMDGVAVHDYSWTGDTLVLRQYNLIDSTTCQFIEFTFSGDKFNKTQVKEYPKRDIAPQIECYY